MIKTFSFDQLEIRKHSDLIARSIQGDAKAQLQLYQLYAKQMLNICYRMMQQYEDAEDMTQEAFSEAFRRLPTFRFESTFGAWLKRITINKCINELQRRKADLLFLDDMQVVERQIDEQNDLPELSIEKIREAMNELPNGSRMIFSLYLLEGYDHQEIAEILNISVSNSKSQYMRARQRIKEILKDKIYEN